MDQIQSLADRREIEHVLTLYARAIDRLDRELLLNCYHENARDSHAGFDGTAEEFANHALPFLRDMFSATMHHITHVTIELLGDQAAVESYYYAWHRMEGDAGKIAGFFGDAYAVACERAGPLNDGHDFICAGRYLDLFSRRDGAWKIADREITVEWKHFAPASHGAPGSGIARIMAPPARDRSDPVYRNRARSVVNSTAR